MKKSKNIILQKPHQSSSIYSYQWKHLINRLTRHHRAYAFLALIILILTTCGWSYVSARIHHNNADHLVNPYLFDSGSVYAKALFPGQHTYLLKWPIFFLIHLSGNTDTSYIVATVAVSLLTVIGFAYILYTIEKRPLVLGTLYLMVAATLLLVPSQPYPGGLLPVGLAMIANRNLEYIVFIGCMYAVIRHRMRSSHYYVALIGLILLNASDKLFVSLSVGSGIIACMTYVLFKQKHAAKGAGKWLFTSIIAATSSVALLVIGNSLNLIHTSAQGAGPYAFVTSLHKLGLGVVYGCIGILSNFGANPSTGTTYISQMPANAAKHLFSLSGGALIVNLFIFIVATVASYRLFLFGIGKNQNDTVEPDAHFAVAHMLLFASFIACAAFIFTDHYYAADARYVTIVYFSVFVSLAVYIRNKAWTTRTLKTFGFIIIAAMVLSIPAVGKQYQQSMRATTTLDQRNQVVVKALQSHRVAILAGDYWRVIPIRQASQNMQNVMPYADCTRPRDVLSSRAWRPDLRGTSFAYLLSIEKGITDFPACRFETITALYGRPNSSIVIAGSIEKPLEMLLFFDHGANRSGPSDVSQLGGTSNAPVQLSNLANSSCTTSTILNIVAHEDDDLLFINPDTLQAIRDGKCVRTVYITSGDAGSNLFYWLGREQGSQAAYSTMMGVDTIWLQQTVKLGDNRYLTIASPKSNPKISLLYLRLPDGNLRGDGFGSSKHKSLEKLYNGMTPEIRSIYGSSIFTKDSLVDALSDIMKTYKPLEIRTQSSYTTGTQDDHSDHKAVSRFASLAYDEYINSAGIQDVTIKHYRGYTVHNESENVYGDVLNEKLAAFFSYANHDKGVCNEISQCDNHTVYGNYLRRQYLEP